MARLLRRVESIVPRKAREFGGKARNLAALARAGFPVPAAYAIPGSACRDFLRETLDEDEQLEALLAAPERAGAERLEGIRERVCAAELHGRLRVELGFAFEELSRHGAHAVVVRSSSTREDQDAAAAAGLHDTILNVRDEAGVLAAVKACWASLFQPRVLAYLRTVVGAPDASMGVVVQAMVPAEVAGVLFTINPLAGDPGEMVVNASWGLGSAVVDGRVSPDTYRIDKSTGELRDRVVGTKELRVVPAPGGGVVDEIVPEDERAEAVLDDATLAEIASLGTRIEKQFDAPQDVEWALVEGTIYVLQSRPVTATAAAGAWKAKRRDKDRAHIVWSNINVGEALPGVATPLTWSILSAFSELGFRRAFGSLGCTVPKDAELVGNFRGRIYLNMTEFMGIASQVPGLRPKTLLSLGGGGEAERLEKSVEKRSSAGFWARLPLTAARFVRENYRVSQRVRDFEEGFEQERRRYREMDLRVLSPLALDKTLRDVERLLDDSGAIMLTVYGNLLASMVALRMVLELVARDHHEALERGLLTGLADVESAAPGLSLWHIAEMARAEEPVREVILERDPSELRVEDLPEGPTRRALANFIMAHGYRGAREAEIAAPRWREDPSLLFATLRAHVRGEHDEQPMDAERRQRAVRDRAAAELDELLPPPARAAVRHLLSLVQRFMRLRERLRAYVTEVLGMFRDVALDASRRLETQELGIGPGAAFYLTVDELHAVLRGELRNVSTLVRQRRRQYERDVALPDPPDTFVGYPPQVDAPAPDTDALTGLAASSGRYEGDARVLLDPSDASSLRRGEVLVAPYADVGWSPLFTVAGAVVTDLGGPLSHASIVAREYGVPSVVNVKVGTRVIHTGDRVEVDGDAGTVRIIASASRTAADTDREADRRSDGTP